MSDTTYTKKRIFNKIPFNVQNFNSLAMPEKYNKVIEVIYKSINLIFKKLIILKIDIDKNTPYKNIIYFTIYTAPERNHPIIAYCFLKNPENIILIRPIGKKRQYIDIDLFESFIKKKSISKILSKEDIFALYLSVIKSIIIRKKELMFSKDHSLLNCYNIKGCMTQIKKTKNNTEKQIVINKFNDKVKILLISYFTHLENKNYDLAEKILGTSKYSNSDVNIILRKKKKIRGHLEIFIYLYKLSDILIEKLES